MRRLVWVGALVAGLCLAGVSPTWAQDYGLSLSATAGDRTVLGAGGFYQYPVSSTPLISLRVSFDLVGVPGRQTPGTFPDLVTYGGFYVYEDTLGNVVPPQVAKPKLMEYGASYSLLGIWDSQPLPHLPARVGVGGTCDPHDAPTICWPWDLTLTVVAGIEFQQGFWLMLETPRIIHDPGFLRIRFEIAR